jgi:hypothetical protein
MQTKSLPVTQREERLRGERKGYILAVSREKAVDCCCQYQLLKATSI